MAINISGFANEQQPPTYNSAGDRTEQISKLIRLTRLLVIEDDLPTASVIVTFIQSSGYSVSIVNDAPSAVEYVSNSQIDIVLLDTTRIADSGVGLVAELRSIQPELIIIAIVQRRNERLVAEMSQKGVDDYVAQPLDLSDLVFRMRVLQARAAGVVNLETRPAHPANPAAKQLTIITPGPSTVRNSQTAPLRALMARKYALAPPTQAAVEIYTLGPFRLLVRGMLVCDDTSGGRRAVQLLKYLTANICKRVRKEHIADLLWPDLPGDLAANNLRGTLHTLRQILAQGGLDLKSSIRTERGSLFFELDDYYYDVQQFNALIEQAGATERAGHLEDAITIYEQVTSVYRGSYLEMEEDMEWVIYEREQLRERFTSVLVRLADLYIETGYYENAVAVAQRAIQEDWRREAAHRVLMVAYYKSERRNNALITYQNVVDSFKEKLGIAPMQQTRELAAHILREEAI